jgi:hypothetical protein
MITDRFELEQSIMDCWKITDDIVMLEQQGANMSDIVSLASIYEYKFDKLWTIFTQMIKDRNIT